MRDKFLRFVENINGQFTEVSDSSNRFQCMDLAYLWVFCLDIPKASIQRLYAYEVFTKPNSLTTQYFDRIPNTPDGVPQAGDLVVFGQKLGVAGHIAIASGRGNTSIFESFDQNYPVGSKPHLQQHDYVKDNVLGWLRPKITAPVTTITWQTKIPQIVDSNGNPMEVQQINSVINDGKKAIIDLTKDRDIWKNKANKLIDGMKALLA